MEIAVGQPAFIDIYRKKRQRNNPYCIFNHCHWNGNDYKQDSPPTAFEEEVGCQYGRD